MSVNLEEVKEIVESLPEMYEKGDAGPLMLLEFISIDAPVLIDEMERLKAKNERLLERLKWHERYFTGTVDGMRDVWPPLVLRANEKALEETRTVIDQSEKEDL